uniref:Uncharacterized protein n=1 Tax=Rhizophora mucronata TaxID=61149 RepID=A0A2P2NJB0_RHIMU
MWEKQQFIKDKVETSVGKHVKMIYFWTYSYMQHKKYNTQTMKKKIPKTTIIVLSLSNYFSTFVTLNDY